MNSDSASDLIARLRAERIPVSVLVEQPISSGHATTAELLREWEVLRWRMADTEMVYGKDSLEAEITRHLVAGEHKAIVAELHRRELAKAQPSAPAWPDAQPDKRAEWEEIKRRTDLLDLANRLLGEGTKKGPATWFRCFGHEDRTPSLAVYEDQHFHCYGCGLHGDCIDLARGAMQLSSFQATMALLGEWSGVTSRTVAIQAGDEIVEVKDR